MMLTAEGMSAQCFVEVPRVLAMSLPCGHLEYFSRYLSGSSSDVICPVYDTGKYTTNASSEVAFEEGSNESLQGSAYNSFHLSMTLHESGSKDEATFDRQCAFGSYIAYGKTWLDERKSSE